MTAVRRTLPLRRRGAAPALLLVLGLAIAACGGSGDGGVSSATTARTPDDGGSGQPLGTNPDAGGPPAPGAPCSKPDIVVHIDATNTDVRCTADGSGALVWAELPREGSGSGSGSGSSSAGLTSSDEIPAVIENVGFALAPFDPATGFAGALKVTGVVTPKVPDGDPNKPAMDARNEFLFLPFGSSEGGGETDPQWSFFLPLGTEVISLITGTVCDVPKLYSGDYSIRVVPDGVPCETEGRASMMFETEHVIDPLVQFGDQVTAGQHIATVSDYQRLWTAIGFGIVEIGVAYNLDGDGSPWHACPTRFFAPAVRQQLVDTLTSVMDAWATELGKPDLYAGADTPDVGCYTADVHA